MQSNEDKHGHGSSAWQVWQQNDGTMDDPHASALQRVLSTASPSFRGPADPKDQHTPSENAMPKKKPNMQSMIGRDFARILFWSSVLPKRPTSQGCSAPEVCLQKRRHALSGTLRALFSRIPSPHPRRAASPFVVAFASEAAAERCRCTPQSALP